MIPIHIMLVVVFASIFALVVLLPLLIKRKRQKEQRPGEPKVLEKMAVSEPKIPPSEGSRAEPSQKQTKKTAELIKAIIEKLLSLLTGTLGWGFRLMKKLPLLAYPVIIAISLLLIYLLIPTYFVLLIVFVVIFASVVLLPLVIEYKRRMEKGPAAPRVFPETTVIAEKPEIATPPKEARPEPLKKFLFAKRPRRAERIGRLVTVLGDVTIPSGTEVSENVAVQGYLRIGRNCHLHASVKATQGIEIGEGTVVEGNVISGLNAIIGTLAKIKGVIDAAEDVTLHEKVTAKSVAAGKNIKLGPDVSVKGRMQAGTSIVALKALPKLPLELPKISRAPAPAPRAARERPLLEDLLILDELFTRGKIGLKEYVERRSELIPSAEDVRSSRLWKTLEEMVEKRNLSKRRQREED